MAKELTQTEGPTSRLLNELIPDPALEPIKPKNKGGRPRKNSLVDAIEKATAPDTTVDGYFTPDEILYREGFLVLLRNFEVKSLNSMEAAARLANEYVRIIKERFDK